MLHKDKLCLSWVAILLSSVLFIDNIELFYYTMWTISLLGCSHCSLFNVLMYQCCHANMSLLQGSLVEQGLIQHQGDLTVIESRFSSSSRRVFLFENLVIIAKKTSKDGKELFTFKESHRVGINKHNIILKPSIITDQ